MNKFEIINKYINMYEEMIINVLTFNLINL